MKPSADGLETAIALLRDGCVVYQGPFAPVTAGLGHHHKVRAIPITGKLALGADMPTGSHTLEVIVRRKDAKTRAAAVVRLWSQAVSQAAAHARRRH